LFERSPGVLVAPVGNIAEGVCASHAAALGKIDTNSQLSMEMLNMGQQGIQVLALFAA
jgi:hypothetical protein